MRIQRTRGEKEGDSDHRSYRTHLIFAGKRDQDQAGQNVVSQTGLHYYGNHSTTLTFPSHSNHPFAQAQQQLRPPTTSSSCGPSFNALGPHHTAAAAADLSRRKVNRSFTMDEDCYRSANKQVSFGASGSNSGPWTFSNYTDSGGGAGAHSLQPSPTSFYGNGLDENGTGKPGMLEVVAGLSRDCFIIPLACVDRFLPAGLTLPEPKTKINNNLSVTPSNTSMGTPLNILEVADPQLAIVVHLMTPLLPLSSPPLESPVLQPDRVQRSLAMQLLQRAAHEKQSSHGILLSSMETSSDFPLMTLYVVPKLRGDVSDVFVENARKNALDVFDPTKLGFCGDHFFHLCREVATIARPPFENSAKRCGRTSSTGYIISIFRVFEGDDREKLERNWLYWTGARTLYRHLPKNVGLRRITLHKSAAARGDKLYLLLCECANFLENVNSAAQLLPALRARLCGYTGIYRVAAAF